MRGRPPLPGPSLPLGPWRRLGADCGIAWSADGGGGDVHGGDLVQALGDGGPPVPGLSRGAVVELDEASEAPSATDAAEGLPDAVRDAWGGCAVAVFELLPKGPSAPSRLEAWSGLAALRSVVGCVGQ